jgi:hypothetical protein
MKKLLTLIFGTFLIMMSACSEKTTEKVERIEVNHDTPAVVVPDKDKDVNVTIHEDTVTPPVIIHHDQKTTSTTQTDDTGSVTVETHSETVH